MQIVLGTVKNQNKCIQKFMLIFNLTLQFSSTYVMKLSIIIIIIIKSKIEAFSVVVSDYWTSLYINLFCLWHH